MDKPVRDGARRRAHWRIKLNWRKPIGWILTYFQR
jgi:hypothetical protein